MATWGAYFKSYVKTGDDAAKAKEKTGDGDGSNVAASLVTSSVPASMPASVTAAVPASVPKPVPPWEALPAGKLIVQLDSTPPDTPIDPPKKLYGNTAALEISKTAALALPQSNSNAARVAKMFGYAAQAQAAQTLAAQGQETGQPQEPALKGVVDEVIRRGREERSASDPARPTYGAGTSPAASMSGARGRRFGAGTRSANGSVSMSGQIDALAQIERELLELQAMSGTPKAVGGSRAGNAGKGVTSPIAKDAETVAAEGGREGGQSGMQERKLTKIQTQFQTSSQGPVQNLTPTSGISSKGPKLFGNAAMMFSPVSMSGSENDDVTPLTAWSPDSRLGEERMRLQTVPEVSENPETQQVTPAPTEEVPKQSSLAKLFGFHAAPVAQVKSPTRAQNDASTELELKRRTPLRSQSLGFTTSNKPLRPPQAPRNMSVSSLGPFRVDPPALTPEEQEKMNQHAQLVAEQFQKEREKAAAERKRRLEQAKEYQIQLERIVIERERMEEERRRILEEEERFRKEVERFREEEEEMRRFLEEVGRELELEKAEKAEKAEERSSMDEKRDDPAVQGGWRGGEKRGRQPSEGSLSRYSEDEFEEERLRFEREEVERIRFEEEEMRRIRKMEAEQLRLEKEEAERLRKEKSDRVKKGRIEKEEASRVRVEREETNRQSAEKAKRERLRYRKEEEERLRYEEQERERQQYEEEQQKREEYQKQESERLRLRRKEEQRLRDEQEESQRVQNERKQKERQRYEQAEQEAERLRRSEEDAKFRKLKAEEERRAAEERRALQRKEQQQQQIRRQQQQQLQKQQYAPAEDEISSDDDAPLTKEQQLAKAEAKIRAAFAGLAQERSQLAASTSAPALPPKTPTEQKSSRGLVGGSKPVSRIGNGGGTSANMGGTRSPGVARFNTVGGRAQPQPQQVGVARGNTAAGRIGAAGPRAGAGAGSGLPGGPRGGVLPRGVAAGGLPGGPRPVRN